MTDLALDPAAEASARLGGQYAVRVLEPSPPPVTVGPWLADDPVHAPVDAGLPVVSPVANGTVTWDQLASDDAELAEWCADRWLGAWRSLSPVTDVGALVRTRTAWQAVAERVLAPARHRANGKIGLRFTRGGFGTPYFDDDGTPTQLRVVGTDVVTIRGDEHTTTPIPLLPPSDGADEDLGYTTTSVMSREVLAQVDHPSANLLGEWLGLGCSVLEELRFGQPDADATRCQIWPEHLDCGIELGDDAAGRRATFGASAGDDAHLEPYLYVMPWSDGPADPFWNDTAFRGASLSYAQLVGTPDARGRALEFLRTGLAVATGRRFRT